MFNLFKKEKEAEEKALDEKYKELDSTDDEVDPADIPDEPVEDPDEDIAEQESAEAEEEVSSDELNTSDPKEAGEEEQTAPEMSTEAVAVPGTAPAPNPADFSNPRLLGLINEFNDKKEDQQFLANLWFTIAHSKFLVPIHFTEEPERGEDGVARFKQGTQVAFPNLTDPNDANRHVLPVFTDYDTLGRWKALRENDGRPEVTVVTFSDISVIVGDKLQGFAVNPFGPSTLTMGRDAIDMIKNLPGYKAEMERAKQLEEYRKEHKGEGVQVAILEPKETPEEKQLERDLITAAAASDDIAKIGLVVTRPQIPGSELAYLCIVDCPAEKSQEIFKSIGEQVKPHLQIIKRMDFILISKCSFAEKYFGSHPFIYPPF